MESIPISLEPLVVPSKWGRELDEGAPEAPLRVEKGWQVAGATMVAWRVEERRPLGIGKTICQLWFQQGSIPFFLVNGFLWPSISGMSSLSLIRRQLSCPHLCPDRSISSSTARTPWPSDVVRRLRCPLAGTPRRICKRSWNGMRIFDASNIPTNQSSLVYAFNCESKIHSRIYIAIQSCNNSGWFWIPAVYCEEEDCGSYQGLWSWCQQLGQASLFFGECSPIKMHTMCKVCEFIFLIRSLILI